MRRGMCRTRTPCKRYVLTSQKRKKENKKWLCIQTRTQTTQRSQHRQKYQVEKKVYTNDTDS